MRMQSLNSLRVDMGVIFSQPVLNRLANEIQELRVKGRPFVLSVIPGQSTITLNLNRPSGPQIENLVSRTIKKFIAREL